MTFLTALGRRANLVAFVTAVALAFGADSLRSLPSGLYPEVDFPRIVVVAHVGDLPPEVVVTTATRPLEESIITVPGVRRLRSRTIRGATELSAQLDPSADVWRVLQLIGARVADVRHELPDDAEVRVERVTPTALPVITFNVSGNVSGDVDPRVARETAARVLRPVLTRVPGVGLVDVIGGDERELEVILDPDALAAAHLTPSAVADRLAASELVVAVGRAAEAHQVLTVLAASERQEPAAIAALPIAVGPNGDIPLSSVASVTEGAVDRTQTVSGADGDAVAVTVSRAPGASAPAVARAAADAVQHLRDTHALPTGVRIERVYDQSELIDDAMASVRDAILLGVALSLVVLAVFLRDLRAGFAAAIAVPVTLVTTFGAMRLFGQTLNLMSLGGLAVAIGLVVDDAIVIVEAIVLRIEHGSGVADAAELGTADLLAAVVGTTLTTVVVFAPLGLISGVVGSFFGALALTLSSAVLLSLVVSLTVVPLTARRVLRPRPAGGSGAGAGTGARIAAGYAGLVRRIVRHPALSLAALLAVAGAGAFGASRVGTGFLPAMDEGALVIDFFLPPGTSLDETDRVAQRIDRVLATTPAVASFTRRTGAELGPAAATQQNRGDILVRLVPRNARRSIYVLMDSLRERLEAEVPEARIELVQMLQDVLDDLSGNPRPIEVKLFGPDAHTLDALAEQAATRIEGVTDLRDLFRGVEGNVPSLRVDVDPRAAMRLGVTPSQVAADLGVALAGRVAGHVRAGDRLLGVRVRMPDAVRFSPERIAALPLAYGAGPVPLSAVAAVSRPAGPSALMRENLAGLVMLTAAVRPGADLGAVTGDVEARLRGLALPEGYRLEVGGQLEGARRAQKDLAEVFGLGVALVLAILIVQLGSLRLALVVLAGAPLALVGALLTLAATGVLLNASSLMGCVLLAGLVVKNGILLLERANAEARDGHEYGEALARAGERRLRPIVMTTAATVAGLLPLALGLGAGAELQRPLAIATIGGLLVATATTLFALPALACALAGDRRV